MIEVTYCLHMLFDEAVFIDGLVLLALFPVFRHKVVFKFGLISVVFLDLLASVVLDLKVWEGGSQKHSAPC